MLCIYADKDVHHAEAALQPCVQPPAEAGERRQRGQGLHAGELALHPVRHLPQAAPSQAQKRSMRGDSAARACTLASSLCTRCATCRE